MKIKNIHHHGVWTNLWVDHRDAVMRVWSRMNLEGRNVLWTARDVLPSIVVAGEIEYGDMEFLFAETNDALRRAMLWRR